MDGLGHAFRKTESPDPASAGASLRARGETFREAKALPFWFIAHCACIHEKFFLI